MLDIYDRVVESRTKKEHEEHSHKQEGTMLPFGMIVKAEGGWKDPAAIKAAYLYCMKATALGKGWLGYNWMTERFEFSHVRQSQTHVFNEAWTLCRKELSKYGKDFDDNALVDKPLGIAQSLVAQAAHVSLAGSPAGSAGKPKAAGSGAESLKRRHTEGAASVDPPKKDPKDPKKVPDVSRVAASGAKKTAIAYKAARDQAGTVIDCINRIESWGWALGSKDQTLMVEAKDALENAAANCESFMDYMVDDGKAVKSNYGDRSIDLFKSYPVMLDRFIADLRDKVKVLINMNSSRPKKS